MSALFFFNDTATTEIYTLSLHDALPICGQEDDAVHLREATGVERDARVVELEEALLERRKERPEEVALRVARPRVREGEVKCVRAREERRREDDERDDAKRPPEIGRASCRE